ncbi:hypothetical protein F383_08876 [Gossypium arboreum]|uniref:Uncharacterized protein n=1 Tax=Gossypium arboreum TaxID=29729 RepID=A0A0B0PFX9_GOSAR|nr:hypothetical protein F383_08876 [Gossypium arboreum]
MTVSDSFRRG